MEEEIDWHESVYKKVDKESGLAKAEWRLLRDDVLCRDRWTCQRCETKYRTKKMLTAHHIIPRANEGSNTLNNLITLCNKCHDFVEMNGLKNKAEIIGSFDDKTLTEKIEIVEADDPDPYGRPEWHRWVYGGGRNPYINGRGNAQNE